MEPIPDSSLFGSNISLVSLDVNAFITEVEARPAIWDCNLKYDRSDKIKAWEEISHIFIKDFAHKSRRDKLVDCDKLQKKWKSLRDCFNREIALQKKSRKPGRKKYLYFKKLSFLKSQRKDIHSEDETTENDSGVEQQHIINETTRRIKREKEEASQSTDKSGIEIFLEPEIDLPYGSCKCRKYEDPDKDFLMSILPDIRRINDDLKIDFKSEVLQLIKNYRRVENFKIE